MPFSATKILQLEQQSISRAKRFFRKQPFHISFLLLRAPASLAKILFFFKSSQTRRKKARDFLELSNDSVFMKTDVVRLFLVVFKHCDILELSWFMTFLKTSFSWLLQILWKSRFWAARSNECHTLFGREIRAPFFSKFVVREMINSFRQAKSLLRSTTCAARKLKDATSSSQFCTVGQNIRKLSHWKNHENWQKEKKNLITFSDQNMWKIVKITKLYIATFHVFFSNTVGLGF